MPDVPNSTCTRCGRDLRTLVAQSCATCGVGPLRADLSVSDDQGVLAPAEASDKPDTAKAGTPETPSTKSRTKAKA